MSGQDADARAVVDMQGATALPRRNGELVFEDPWQGRVFGIAVSLQQQGCYDWEAFRTRLIEEIGEGGAEASAVDANHYYSHWLAALERLLVEEGLVERAQLEQRIDEYRSGVRDEVF